MQNKRYKHRKEMLFLRRNFTIIFADKLIALRKKAGWSQEELAEQMEVSRQAVSKWEGAQSIPDMNKLLKISQLFSVSLDYLLKDELEEAPAAPRTENAAGDAPLRVVTMEEAHDFLAVKSSTAPLVALGVVLCILCAVPIMLLGAAAEARLLSISEDAAGGIGCILMFLLIAAAVGLFLFCGSKTGKYEFLEKEIFETAYGVTGMVKERKAAFHDTFTKSIIIGVLLCICSLLPVFAGIILDEENDFLMVSMCSLMFVFISLGVYLFVRAGILQASFDMLLQEGDYTDKKKKKAPFVGCVITAYWLFVTALYVAIGFITGNWGRSAAPLWSVAGILFVPVILLTDRLAEKKIK